MRELFIRESDDKKVKMTAPITLIVALLFLLIFAGCSAVSGTAGQAAATPPAVTSEAR